MHVCVLISFLYKDTSQIGSGPTPMTSFYLNYLFKGPLSKCSHFLRCWELGLQHMSFGGDLSLVLLLPGKYRTRSGLWSAGLWSQHFHQPINRGPCFVCACS